MKTQRKRGKQGFTLMELLVVLTILIVMIMMALPDSVKVRARAEDQQMIQRGLALNAAIAELVADQGPAAAQTLWTAAAGDQAKYNLLRQYMAYPPPNLTGGTGGSYVVFGYTVQFPATISNLQNGVTVQRGTLTILSSAGVPFP